MGRIYDLKPGTTKTVTRTTITVANDKKKKKKKKLIGVSRKQFFAGGMGSKTARGGLTGLFKGRGLL